MLYADLLAVLVEEARGDEEIVAALLTGSLARGDALPGTDIDLRYVLADGLERESSSVVRDGVLVERGFADLASARATLEANPMHVYAYLDGRILYDPHGALAELAELARRTYETYRTPAEDSDRIAFLLRCAWDKISVAWKGGDQLKAAFVTSTSSWQIIEGLGREPPAAATEQLGTPAPGRPRDRPTGRGGAVPATLPRQHRGTRPGRPRADRLDPDHARIRAGRIAHGSTGATRRRAAAAVL